MDSNREHDTRNHLADFVRDHKEQIIERWCERIRDRLGLEHDQPQLIDHLPQFLDEMVTMLRQPPQEWRPPESARSHGRHRLQLGVDIGGLTEEIGIVGETIMDLAAAQGQDLSPYEGSLLIRVIARGTAESVKEYAEIRDRQLTDHAARHVAFVAHEIRNPLNIAMMAGQLLSESTGDVSSYRKRLTSALTQLSNLVNDRLVRARLDDRPEPATERVTARELVDAACADSGPGAEQRRIELTSEIDDLELEVDPKLIRSALTNLTTNAVKFSRKDGTVLVRARAEGDRAVFEVHDECGGMPEHLPEQLFQAHVQGGADRSGFGLGLLISRQAVEAHDGEIRVVNQPPKGCCFIIELPRERD